MKFKDRKEMQTVCETMAALLVSLRPFANENTRDCIKKTLIILNETEIEGEDL